MKKIECVKFKFGWHRFSEKRWLVASNQKKQWICICVQKLHLIVSVNKSCHIVYSNKPPYIRSTHNGTHMYESQQTSSWCDMSTSNVVGMSVWGSLIFNEMNTCQWCGMVVMLNIPLFLGVNQNSKTKFFASFNSKMFQRCLRSFTLNCVNLFIHCFSTRFKYISKIRRVNKMFKPVKFSFSKGDIVRFRLNKHEIHAVLPCVCVHLGLKRRIYIHVG